MSVFHKRMIAFVVVLAWYYLGAAFLERAWSPFDWSDGGRVWFVLFPALALYVAAFPRFKP